MTNPLQSSKKANPSEKKRVSREEKLCEKIKIENKAVHFVTVYRAKSSQVYGPHGHLCLKANELKVAMANANLEQNNYRIV